MYDRPLARSLPLLLILGWTMPCALAVDAAGTVVFATGEVKAIDSSGRSRYLIKGDQVFPADTLATGDGKIQVRFSDGGYASLKADTQYRLSDYVYRGSTDGSERGFFHLLKGTVRFVTGAIGKANRKNFRINTKTATIGIRGSSGLAVSCVAGSCGAMADGTYLTTYSGILTIASGSFSGEVLVQETYFCDGVGCTKVDEQALDRPLAPVLPELDQGYRQGEQYHPPPDLSPSPPLSSPP